MRTSFKIFRYSTVLILKLTLMKCAGITLLLLATAPNTITEVECFLCISGGTSKRLYAIILEIGDFIYHKFLVVHQDSNMATMVLQVVKKQATFFFVNGFQFCCEDITTLSAVRFHPKIIPNCFGNGHFADISFPCQSALRWICCNGEFQSTKKPFCTLLCLFKPPKKTFSLKAIPLF